MSYTNIIAFFLCFSDVSCIVQTCGSISVDTWKSTSFLNNKFDVKWNILERSQEIQLYLEIKNSSATWYILITIPHNYTNRMGFGISESGHMLGSDIASVSYFKNEITVDDRNVPWAAYPLDVSPSIFPVLDEKNDWTILCGTKSESSLSAIISRQLSTGDSEDRPILVDKSTPVIVAWGSSTTSKISYHGPSQRTTGSITFSGNAPVFPPADADGVTTLIMNKPFVTDGLDPTMCVRASTSVPPHDM